MATFNHIGGQEPSTINFKLATVTQTRNSSVMHQEIMALGDPDSSNAIAAVLNAVPASTAWGLVVRQVGNSSITGNSTVFQGTSPWVIAGNSTVAPLAGSTWATRPIQSSAADLQMTATPVAGSTWATRPIQSSAADLQMTATPASGSTWRTQPGSTLWASSAGFHFNSSGELQTVATISISSLSSVAGKVTVSPFSTTPEPAFSVRISDGSTWVVDYLNASTFTSTAVAGGVNFVRAGASSISSSDLFIIPWASTQGAQYIIPVTDSGVSVMDSTNRAINVNVVAGSAASTTVQVSSVAGRVATMPNSTLWASSAGFHFDSSGAMLIAGNFSAAFSSTKADNLVTVYQSSAAELQATVTPVAGSTWRTQPGSTLWASSAGFHFNSSGELQIVGTFSASTTVQVSSVGGVVNVQQNSTVWQVQVGGYSTTVQVSSVGGVVTIAGNSTAVIQGNSTAFQGGTWTVNVGTHIQSSVAPSSGSSGVVVRQVIDAIQTFASTSALASTTVSVASSAASIRAYVTAYSITSTNQTAAHWGFFSSNATLLWPITLAALSSGVAGANLAVAPPGYLFRTAASEALNFKTAGSTVAGVQMGVSYFLAP